MPVDHFVPAIEGTRFRLIEVVETGSTNADLVELVRAGEPPFLAIRAGYQTDGRGRRDRSWEAPPESGLMMSVLFPANSAGGFAGNAQQMASCLGLATLHACRSFRVDAMLKWPNDLVGPVPTVGTLPKLAGLLGEVVTRGGEALGIVVGVGLNLRPVPDREAALGRSVVVLDELTDERMSPTDMAHSVLLALESVLRRVEQSDGSEWLRRELVSESAVVGCEVEVDIDGLTTVGVAVDIDHHGRLLIETAGGVQPISVGDVVSARLRR